MHSRATDRRSASKCQGKWPDQTLDQAFGLPEVLVAVSTSRLSCKRAGKTRTLMPVWDSSGESRLNADLWRAGKFPARLLDHIRQPAPRSPPTRGERDRSKSMPLPSGSSTKPARTPTNVGRNDPCPCGSGKKFKKCCGTAAKLGSPATQLLATAVRFHQAG